MWQQVLGEIDSTIGIAYQMAHVTVPMRHSLANTGVRMWELETTRYNEIHIVPLTTENLALHDQFHGRTTWIIPSEDHRTLLDEVWFRGRSTHYVTTILESIEATRDNNWRPAPLRTTTGRRHWIHGQRGRRKTRNNAKQREQSQKQSFRQQIPQHRRQEKPALRTAR